MGVGCYCSMKFYTLEFDMVIYLIPLFVMRELPNDKGIKVLLLSR
jgi:hypothetical protein